MDLCKELCSRAFFSLDKTKTKEYTLIAWYTGNANVFVLEESRPSGRLFSLQSSTEWLKFLKLKAKNDNRNGFFD